jgi:hypothetical protein
LKPDSAEENAGTISKLGSSVQIHMLMNGAIEMVGARLLPPLVLPLALPSQVMINILRKPSMTHPNNHRFVMI